MESKIDQALKSAYNKENIRFLAEHHHKEVAGYEEMTRKEKI